MCKNAKQVVEKLLIKQLWTKDVEGMEKWRDGRSKINKQHNSLIIHNKYVYSDVPLIDNFKRLLNMQMN